MTATLAPWALPWTYDETLLERFADEPTPIDWVVPGIIPAGTVGILYGPGGAGKSTFAFDLGCAIATGTTPGYLDALKTIYPGGVFLVSSEDHERWLHQRVHAARKRYPWHQLRDSMRVLNLYGRCAPLFRVERSEIITTETYDQLYALIEQQASARLVILDGRSRLCGTEGSGNGLVPQEIAALEKWAVSLNCAIMLLHHSPKSSFGNRVDARAAARGETALYDAVRFALYLRDLDEKSAEQNGLTESERRQTLVLSFAKCQVAAPQRDVVIRRTADGGFEPVAGIKVNPSRAEIERQREAQDMTAVLSLIHEHPGSSGRALCAVSPISRARTIAALDAAVAEGVVTETKGAHRASLYAIA